MHVARAPRGGCSRRPPPPWRRRSDRPTIGARLSPGITHSAPISAISSLSRRTVQIGPPTRSRASTTVTSHPASVRTRAAASPARPAPTTTTLRTVSTREKDAPQPGDPRPCAARRPCGTHRSEPESPVNPAARARGGDRSDGTWTTATPDESAGLPPASGGTAIAVSGAGRPRGLGTHRTRHAVHGERRSRPRASEVRGSCRTRPDPTTR